MAILVNDKTKNHDGIGMSIDDEYYIILERIDKHRYLVYNTTTKEVNQKINELGEYDDVLPLNEWMLADWVNYGTLDLLDLFNQIKTNLKSVIVFDSDVEYDIITCWIIASYKKEIFPSSGFPFFKSRKRECGKTVAIQSLLRLAYRAIYNQCSQTKYHNFDWFYYAKKYNATVLLDNIEHICNGKKFQQFIDQGYVKVDANHKTVFAAMAGTGELIDSNQQRAISIPMFHAKPAYPHFEPITKDLNEIRSKLLFYRYCIPNPDLLDTTGWFDDCGLEGRNRQIFESVLAVANQIGLEKTEIINYALKLKEEIEEEEDLERDIVKIIHDYNGDRISLNQIILELDFGDDLKTKQLIGRTLASLGIKTKRNGGAGSQTFIDKKENQKVLKRLERELRI